MTDMTRDKAVEWLRDHVSDLRSAARVLRESPWGAKLAATATAIDKAADEGTLAIAALEAARDGMTSPVTSPDQILLDAIEREIRQLEGKNGWLPQATRIANLRAAIDQARGKGGCGEGVKS